MRTHTRRPLAIIAGLTLAACGGSESVAPDTDPPVIVITAPTTESTYLTGESTVTVSGTASDDRAVAGVSYQVVGGPSGSAVGTTSWSITGLVLAAGQNALTVTAVDEAGNASTATLTIESDSEGPALTIQTPSTSGTHYTNQSTLTLAGTATDPNGVERVEFAIAGGGATGVAVGTTEWTVEDLDLTEDESEITITALDELGNSSAVSLTVILDTEPPTVQFETPTASTVYATIEDGIMISGTASDAVALDRVEWSIDGGTSQVADGSESWSVDVADLPMGESEVTVVAHDRAGNTASISMSVSRFPVAGPLTLDPTTILTGRLDPLQVSVRIDPALAIGPGGVWLFRLDDANQTVDDGVQLFDDGSAPSGDNLLGDAVYSGLIEVSESAPTEVRLQTVVDVQGTGPGRSTVAAVKVVAPVSAPADATQTAVQQDAAGELDALLGQGSDLASALDQVVDFIDSRPGVESATGSATSIRIEYESGLRGGVFLIRPPNAGGIALARSEPPPGSAFDPSTLWDRLLPPRVHPPSSAASRAGPRIPPHLQTVGRAPSPEALGQGMLEAPEDVILQPSILMAVPYWSARPAVEMNLVGQIVGLLFGETLFRGSTFGSDGVPVTAFRDLTEAGVVMLSTRGSQGLVIATGEIATPELKDAYGALRQSGQIGVWTDVALAPDASGAQIQGDEFVLYPEFIRNLPGTFPRSMILNLSGESTMSTELADAFFSKGAETYFGFDRNVSSLFAASAAGQILQPMVSPQRLTTGEVFVPGQQDPFLDGATFEMIGNDGLHLPTELLNGTFESGDLTGWAFGFNGTRAISQLGPVLPPSGQYMSLVSTGIGLEAAEDPGLLGQTFLVPQDASTLSMKWNFLSEEFLESIGTTYQDSFTIVVTRGITTQPLVQIEMTIDELAGTFGCTDTGGPDCQLIPVSPDIVFDAGDVYMTDWQTTELDVAPYRGQLLTVYVVVANAEDDTYHSAVLLDDFVLQ